MELTDADFIESLQRGDSGAFEILFKAYFDRLYRYSFVIVRETQVAEELVQQVFFRVWEKRKKLFVSSSIQAYLYACVYHECLHYMKRSDTVHYRLDEKELNTLGYQFLQDGYLDKAEETFRLNTLLWPQSFNVYDSYDDALVKEGKTTDAIPFYKL